MPVTPITLNANTPRPDWFIQGFVPSGKLSSLFAPAGVGKTRLLANWAVQAARPDGHVFGRAVQHGRTVILDADDEGGFGYQLWINRFLNTYGDANRSLIDLRVVTDGLIPEDVEALRLELAQDPPVLIVLDSFLAAFVGIDNLQTHRVMEVLNALSGLANSLGCALVLVDHVGKLQPGQTVLQKGAFGSGKGFKPRAMFALSRVPPNEVEGRDVLKLECAKMSYAPEFAPIGFEIRLEQNDTAARVLTVDLPNSTTLSDRAKAAMHRMLLEANGQAVPRKTLLETAVLDANITLRTAERGLKALIAEHGEDLIVSRLPDNSKAFTLGCDGSLAGTPDNAVQDGLKVSDKQNAGVAGTPTQPLEGVRA